MIHGVESETVHSMGEKERTGKKKKRRAYATKAANLRR